MPYDISGHGIGSEDEGEGMLLKAVFGVIAALLIIALAWFVISDAPRENHVEQPGSCVIELNTSNAALMHQYGMPTRADVMEWHYHGQWGYMQGDTLHAFADLPGDSRVWDVLYGIDSDKPGFDK